jgi:hypothetical protein
MSKQMEPKKAQITQNQSKQIQNISAVNKRLFARVFVYEMKNF